MELKKIGNWRCLVILPLFINLFINIKSLNANNLPSHPPHPPHPQQITIQEEAGICPPEVREIAEEMFNNNGSVFVPPELRVFHKEIFFCKELIEILKSDLNFQEQVNELARILVLYFFNYLDFKEEIKQNSEISLEDFLKGELDYILTNFFLDPTIRSIFKNNGTNGINFLDNQEDLKNNLQPLMMEKLLALFVN